MIGRLLPIGSFVRHLPELAIVLEPLILMWTFARSGFGGCLIKYKRY